MVLALAFLALFQQPTEVAVPERLDSLIGRGMTVQAPPSEAGKIENVFDARTDTLFRTASVNPAAVTVTFDSPREAKGFRLFLSDRCRYLIETADSPIAIDSKATGYREVAKGTTTKEGEATIRLEFPAIARAYRLTVWRLQGDNRVQIQDWQFVHFAPATALKVDMLPARKEEGTSKTVPAGGVVRMRAWAIAEGTEVDVTDKAKWEAKEFRVWEPEKFAWEASRFLEGSRDGEIDAAFGDLRAARAFTIESYPRTNGRADVDVLYIEKTPRGGRAKPRSRITWKAHVRCHTRGVTDMPFSWWVDGKEVRKGTLTIAGGYDAEVDLPLKWVAGGQTLEFFVRPPEWDANQNNNKLKTWTDTLGLGVWIEEKLWHYWHDNQAKVNPRNESFENWVQYQVDLANQELQESPSSAPRQKWRLDKVTIVPGMALPLAGGSPEREPDREEKTLDLQWGFGLGVDGKIPDQWLSNKTGASSFLRYEELIQELIRIGKTSQSRGSSGTAR